MSLQNILLGLLEKPASGYDLQKEIESSLRHFWSVRLPQIYPTLRRMEEAGLVTSQVVVSEVGPSRRVYERTAAGRDSLCQWLAAGPHVEDERRHYLAQIYFLSALQSREQSVAFFQDLRSVLEAREEALANAEEQWKVEFGDQFPDRLPEEAFYRHTTFELGQILTQAYLDWCDRSIERLRQRPTDADSN